MFLSDEDDDCTKKLWHVKELLFYLWPRAEKVMYGNFQQFSTSKWNQGFFFL